jgi:uncharacterized metal-binding protein
MDSPRDKVILAPCMGVGKVVANVTRRAAYLAHGACPEDTELLSIPALLAGSEEERALIENHPVVVIEGCVLRCASHVMKFMGVTPAAKIEVTQLIREKRLTPGKTRKELEETGKKLSEVVAERMVDALRDEPTLDSWQEPSDIRELPCACHALEPNDAASDEGLIQLGVKGAASGEVPLTKGVTFLPCQGLKRSGARIAQRAAYHLCEDEDKLLGKSQPLCISALAAGVAEDVHYYQDFPTVALNGCGMNCATKVAELYGIPAVRSIQLAEEFPQYDGEQRSLGEELTPEESALARQWAERMYPEMKELLESTHWQPKAMDTHGMVNDPKGIEAEFGFQKTAKGFDVPTAARGIALEKSTP